MNALVWIVNIVLVLCSLGMVVIVLMQDTKSSGMGAAFGGADSFFGKNKSKTKEARKELLTKVLAVVIAVLAIVMVVMLRFM